MSIRIQFFGVAGYKITTESGKIVVIDPFLTQNPYCKTTVEDLGHVDLLLITHNAFDHFGDAADVIRACNPVTVCALDVQHNLTKYHGIDPDLIRPTIWNMVVEVDGITVRPVESHHWSFAKKEDGALLSGPAMGFIVDVGNGRSVYHPGDTALFSDMKLIGELHHPTIGLMHVSLPSEEGVGMPHAECYKTGELTPAEALMAGDWLGLDTFIASHYVDSECDDVKTLLSLVEARKASNTKCPEVIVMKNDQEIEL